jgi:hypothetical protein
MAVKKVSKFLLSSAAGGLAVNRKGKGQDVAVAFAAVVDGIDHAFDEKDA